MTAPRPAEGNELENIVKERLGRMSLAEKVQLLTGHDFWSTWTDENVGLGRILMSDGPSGVRGEVWDERDPSLNLPSATALAASWDASIATRYGRAAAIEARRKGVHVLLGPTINLHRSPLGGRHFEAFSEDPHLTAELAVAYVNGVQREGVAATPKHYVANDFETERFTADVHVDARALRELYLLPFEAAVVEGRAWAIMSAYNSINGRTATESELLTDPLKSEWGFDGVVISDWTAVRSIESARQGQDLVMPGPDGPWGSALVAAVEAGDIDEAIVDEKVRRILRLAGRVGVLEDIAPSVAPHRRGEGGETFAREAAAEGTVLVANDGILPLEPSTVNQIAVIGDNALNARTQGGGSATVVPRRVVSPLDGIRRAFPDSTITYAPGALIQKGVIELPLGWMANPVTGDAGARTRFLDGSGATIFEEDRRASALVYFGGDAPIARTEIFEFHTAYTPQHTGEIGFAVAAAGQIRVYIDGILRVDETVTPIGADLGAALLAPPSVSVVVDVAAGIALDLRVEYTPTRGDDGLSNAMGITIGTQHDATRGDALIQEAVTAARAADVAVVVVGTDATVESEGFDRTSLSLPGRQDELVAAVVRANPRTIVVVNSGAPVELPWRHDVAALLIAHFGGQEFGDGLADVLTGEREPGGRLATTWPVQMSDAPVLDVTPQEGIVRYDEGIHIGYRAWLRAQLTPAFWFGFGLGYTSWELSALRVEAPGSDADPIRATINVTNTGHRGGKQVVQLYASRETSAVDRPTRWLVGFGVARVSPGESTTVEIDVPLRRLAYWNDGWQLEPGEYIISVGTSVDDLVEAVTVSL